MKKIIGKILGKNRMKKKLFALGIILLFPLVALAISDDFFTPKVSFSEFSVDKTEVKVNDDVIGTFVVKNDGTFAQNDINLQAVLSKKSSVTMKINSKVVESSVFLKSNEVIKREFSYQIPKNLVTGDYILSINAVSGRGTYLGISEDIGVKISGNNRFISFTDGKIVTGDDKEAATETGPVFKIASEPKIKFSVKNEGEEVVATPQVVIYSRTANENNFVKKVDKEKIILKAGEAKEITLSLPSMAKPMVYFAEVSLLDEAQDPLSMPLGFRWIVEGLSPQITKLSSDKNIYKKGESANIIYEIVGSADSAQRKESGKLVVEFWNDKAKLSGSAEEVVSLDGAQKEMNIKLGSAINGYTIKAKIIKGDETLDTYEVKIKGEKQASKPGYLAIVGIILGVVLLGGVTFLYTKGNKKGALNVGILLLMFTVSVVFSGKAFAAERKYIQATKTSGAWNISYDWLYPNGDNKLPGDTIKMRGNIKMVVCNNGLLSEVYEVWLAKSNPLDPTGEIFIQSADSTASEAGRNRIMSAHADRMLIGTAGTAVWGASYSYDMDWTIPTDIDPRFVNQSDTYIVIRYKGDHSGTNPGRYRLILRQRINIINRAPSASIVSPSPGAGAELNYDTSVTLGARGNDPDNNYINVGIRWNGGTESWKGWYPQPEDYEWYLGALGGPGNYFFEVRAIDRYGGDSGWVRRDFSIRSRTLTVSKAGTDSVANAASTVTGSGISCGSDCSEAYANGTPVTLTANPGANIVFIGWGGNCSGTGSCSLTMDNNKNVTAEFRTHKLTCSLTAEPPGGTLPLTFRFTGSVADSLGHATTYTLNFGDNTAPATGTSSSFDINHTYTVNGTYTARLDGTGDTANTVGCPQPRTFTVNPWSGGDQNEVAP